MTRQDGLSQWVATVSTHLAHLSKPQATVLGMWSFGMVMSQSCGLTSVVVFLAAMLGCQEAALRQRLREWYRDAADKKGAHRQTLDVHSCFVPLLAWVLSAWPPSEKRLALAMDATSLGQLFAVLAISVVYRGCAIPVAWVVLPGNTPGAWKTHWLSLLQQLHGSVPADWTVLVLADRGLYAAWLYRQIVSLGWHPYLRINAGGLFRPAAQPTFRPLTTVVPSVGSAWSGRVACFKSRPLLCTLLAAWAAPYTDPWLILTDLAPEQADVCWYSLRAWIEIVFTQMTKGCLFACWCGRDDVADFHLGVVNDDSVNQQLYQLSALGEIELLECRLQAPTEIADAGGELGAVQLLLGLRLQLTQLLRQAILRLGDLLPLRSNSSRPITSAKYTSSKRVCWRASCARVVRRAC